MLYKRYYYVAEKQYWSSQSSNIIQARITPNTIPDLLSNPTFQSDLSSLSSIDPTKLPDRMQQLASQYSINVKDIEAYMNASKLPTTPPVGAPIN